MYFAGDDEGFERVPSETVQALFFVAGPDGGGHGGRHAGVALPVPGIGQQDSLAVQQPVQQFNSSLVELNETSGGILPPTFTCDYHAHHVVIDTFLNANNF